MEIKYLGHSSFLVKTKTAKLVTDPFDPNTTGMKYPKVEADIVTVSHQHKDHNNIRSVSAPQGVELLMIDMAGEFEKKGVRIFGYRTYHDDKKGEERGENIIYKIEAENISILHCGDLGYVPEDSFLDSIGDVDILMVPTGGIYTLDAEQAMAMVKKIEPSIVLPMHFNQDKLDQSKFGKLARVEEFTKKFGIDKPVPQPKLIYKKEEGEEEMKIVVLEI